MKLRNRLLLYFIMLLLTSVIPSCVFAEVVVYGKVAVGLENDQFPNTTIPATSSIQDYGSYFGIRGIENISADTSFIWQIEQTLDIQAGQAYGYKIGDGAIVPRSEFTRGRVTAQENTLASSESYIGVQSTWGRVRLGNLFNYFRAAMGSIDIYNYANGVNGLGLWSRTAINVVLPEAVSYTSIDWHGFTFVALYSFDNFGQYGIFGTNSSAIQVQRDLGGYYQNGVYNFGLNWNISNFSVNVGVQFWPSVGTYPPLNSGFPAVSVPTAAQYNDAYIGRLEFSYNNPDNFMFGVGMQTGNGVGWWGWPTSGGSMNNYKVNPGYNLAGLSSAAYQSQEFGASFGYHLGKITPKIGYVFGNNLMYGGSVLGVLTGSASQIANTGYQQVVLETDYNLNPQTLLFINFGQLWTGETLQNITYCGNGCNKESVFGKINGNNQFFNNQYTFGIGASHTF